MGGFANPAHQTAGDEPRETSVTGVWIEWDEPGPGTITEMIIHVRRRVYGKTKGEAATTINLNVGVTVGECDMRGTS